MVDIRKPIKKLQEIVRQPLTHAEQKLRQATRQMQQVPSALFRPFKPQSDGLLTQFLDLVEHDRRLPVGTLVAPATAAAAQELATTFLMASDLDARQATRLAENLVRRAQRRGPAAGALVAHAFSQVLQPRTLTRLLDKQTEQVNAALTKKNVDFHQLQQASAILGVLKDRLTDPHASLSTSASQLSAVLREHHDGNILPLYAWSCQQTDPGREVSAKTKIDLVGFVKHYLQRDLAKAETAEKISGWLASAAQVHGWSLLAEAAVELDAGELLLAMQAHGMSARTATFRTAEPLILHALKLRRPLAAAALFASGTQDEVWPDLGSLAPLCQSLVAAGGTELALAQAQGASLLTDVDPRWRLTGPQRRALQQVATDAARRSTRASGKLVRRLEKMGYDAADAQRLRDYLRDEADLLINFQAWRADRFATSNAYVSSPNLAIRFHEHNMFGGRYRGESEHVKYGSLDVGRATRGFSLFGEAMLVLKPEVRERATVRIYGQTGPFPDRRRMPRALGTLANLDHILVRLPKKAVQQAINASRGDKVDRPALAARPVEIQVHGALEFARDVAKVIVERSCLFERPQDFTALQTFCRTNALTLQTRGVCLLPTDERQRSLRLLSDFGWAVGQWTVCGGRDLFLFPSSKQDLDHNIRFRQEEHLFTAQAGIGELGAGERIVGYHADGKTGSAQMLLQRIEGDQGRPDYTFLQTTAFAATLRDYGRRGLRLVAHAQIQPPGHSAQENLLVAEENAEASYTYQIREAANTAAAAGLIGQKKRDGWTLATATGSPTGRLTLVFLQEGEVEASPPAWPLPPEQIVSLVNNSPTTAVMEPITSVPSELLFVTESGHAFDVNELVSYIANQTHGQLTNWWTQQPLSEQDSINLLQHPSGAGQRIGHLMVASKEARKRISTTTAEQIGRTAKAMLGAVTARQMDQVLLAAAELSAFFETLPARERLALHAAFFDVRDTHDRGARSRESVMGALVDLQAQTRTTCFHKPASFLQQMAAELKRQERD